MLKLTVKLSHLMHLLMILIILPAGSATDTQGPMEVTSYTEHLKSRFLSPDISSPTRAQQCYTRAKTEAKNLDNTLKC